MSILGCIENRALGGVHSHVQVIGDSVFLDFLFTREEFEPTLISHIDYSNYKKTNSYKFNLSLEGCDFLCAYYPSDSRFYIGSKNLASEMLALAYCEELGEMDHNLNEHTYKIASLSVNNSPSVIEKISFDSDLPNFTEEQYLDVNNQSTRLVGELKLNVSAYKLSLFEKISDHALGLSANFELIRVHLLKFLAILPCLDHDHRGDEVKRVFLEMLRRLVSDSKSAKVKKCTGQKRSLPSLYIFIFKMKLACLKYIPAGILARSIKFVVAMLAKRFIAGENIANAKSSLKLLLDSGRDATLDQLGELIVSPKEADEYKESVLEIISGIDQHIQKGSRNAAGILRAHVSIKVSALAHDFRAEAFDHVYNQVAPRLIEILDAAKKHQVFINIDAEHYHYRDLVFNIYKKVLLDNSQFEDFADTGIVVQAYLRDAYSHLQEIIKLSAQRNLKMPIRLVKGAYWDAETIEACAHSFDPYQFLNKEETDLHFRQLIEVILKEDQYVCLALASHNILDHCFGESLRDNLYPNSSPIEHQCLHMTYEGLSVGLEKMGWCVRNYIPIGNLLIGMAYLVRRIMENSSQVGILTIMRSHKKEVQNISPYTTLMHTKETLNYEYDQSIAKTGLDFFNINPLRAHRKSEIKAIVSHINSELKIDDINESSAEQINAKLLKLSSSESSFRKVSLYHSLIRLSSLILLNRTYLSAIIIKESGKTLVEAIADVDEAIDFINFYLREELKNLKIKETEPLGLIGVIAPWNFPLAIACGMSVAALVTGNKVILKPSECTPAIIAEFLKLCRQARINESLFDVAYGAAEVGEQITSFKNLSGVVFTGSKSIGVSLYKKMNSMSFDSQTRFNDKICISEMGGKNAIIVTNNCELDETVSGIIYSAFAHAGQKCSAASRIIVDKQIKDKLIARLTEAARSIKVGSSLDFSTFINPLIRPSDKMRVKELMPKIINEAKTTKGHVHLDLTQIESDMNLVGPAIIELTSQQARKTSSYAQQELFAPIIHIIGYDTLEESLEIFNSTQFALTGGIYCQSQDDIDYLSSKMMCGNIYVNRPNTGARVGIEPFGGFKMSGTGPKAGGVDYLNSFKSSILEKRTIIDDSAEFSSEEIRDKYHSGLSYKSRKQKAIDVINLILDQYESFSENIDYESRAIIERLLKDISLDCYKIDSITNENTKIPGQISLSLKDVKLGSGVMLTNHTRFDTRLFSMLMVNLVLGNSIDFVCTTKKSKSSWDRVFEHIFSCGFSSFNTGITLCHIKDIYSVLSQAHFIAYNNELGFNHEFREFFSQTEFKNYLPRVINADRFSLRIWEDEHINLFTHTRAFAINTMRHGAPLELDL